MDVKYYFRVNFSFQLTYLSRFMITCNLYNFKFLYLDQSNCSSIQIFHAFTFNQILATELKVQDYNCTNLM